MSKIFYDQYIFLEELETELDSCDFEREERDEIDSLIEEMIHHRVLDRLLVNLPKEHHEEFLKKFHSAPYNEDLIAYINSKIESSVEEHVKDEMAKLKKEILEDIKKHKI